MLLGARFRTGETTHSVTIFDARFRCATCGVRCFHPTTTSVRVQRIVGTRGPTVTLAPTSLCSALLWLKTNKQTKKNSPTLYVRKTCCLKTTCPRWHGGSRVTTIRRHRYGIHMYLRWLPFQGYTVLPIKALLHSRNLFEDLIQE